jgi:hypothetical protein
MRSLGMFNYNPMDQGVRTLLQAKTPSYQPQEEVAQPQEQAIPKKTINTPVEKEMAQDVAKRPMTRAQAAKEAAILKEKRKEQVVLNKDNKPKTKQILDEYKTAVTENRDLDRMEKLINTKNLTRPRVASAIKTLSKGIFGLGIDLSSLMTPESQEFDKLSMGFLKNLKSYFGARITQVEVENFLKTVPSLLQSREGKRRVIYNLRLNNEAKMLKKNALDSLRTKYGNDIPGDVDELVENIIAPKLDALAEKFKAGMPSKIKKEKPEEIIPGPSRIAKRFMDSYFGKG